MKYDLSLYGSMILGAWTLWHNATRLRQHIDWPFALFWGGYLAWFCYFIALPAWRLFV